MAALQRCGTLLLRRRGAIHAGGAPVASADKGASSASAALSDVGAQRKAEFDNAPISSAGGPPPEVSPEELRTWERRLGGTAHAFPGAGTVALRQHGARLRRVTRRADWIERWSRGAFYKTGYAATALAAGAAALLGPLSAPALAIAAPVAAYWAIGLRDIKQTRHTVRRNFPVLGNVRYMFGACSPVVDIASSC
jgi:hypothetical protein